MAEIRKAAEKNPELAEAWTTSVAPMLDTVAARFRRLKVKGEPITTMDPVTDAEEDAVIQVRHLTYSLYSVAAILVVKLLANRCFQSTDFYCIGLYAVEPIS